MNPFLKQNSFLVGSSSKLKTLCRSKQILTQSKSSGEDLKKILRPEVPRATQNFSCANGIHQELKE